MYRDDTKQRAGDRRSAILAGLPFWIVAVVALAGAAYFHLSEELVAGYTAESFYAILFGVVSLAAVGYGALRARSRMRRYDL